MKNRLGTILIFSILAAIPVITWYSLSSGLEFRQEALKELQVKDSISVTQDTLGVFAGHTSILVLHHSSAIVPIKDALFEQFKHAKNFQMISLDSLNELAGSDYLKSHFEKFNSSSFLLIDQNAYIRNSYSTEEHDIKKLIEHTAIILPMKERGEVKFKKDNQ